MQRKVSKQNIIDALVLENTKEVNNKFKEELETSLISNFSNKLFNMNKLIVGTLGVFSLLLLGLMVYNIYMPKPTQKVEYDTVQTSISSDDQGDAAMGMKLAVNEYNSISEAKESLSFTPLKPYTLFGGQLESVQTGKTFDGSKSDMIFLSFAKDNDFLFKLAQVKQSAQDFVKPEGSEEITVNVNGSDVKAYYYVNDLTDIDPNSEMALYEGASAKSGLQFNLNGINVDISVFGELTKENVVEIARSLE